MIYGSGFESDGDLLGRLSRGRKVFGNHPEVVGLLKDPGSFFPLLDRLKIPRPETRLTPPARPAGWLAKRPGGSGGIDVRPAAETTPGVRVYYQRVVPGRTFSATFLANRERAFVIGFNRQWASMVRPEHPYQFGGAVGGVAMPGRLKAEIAGALDRLVAETGLVGLNGLDFILSANRWLVLELNPRPTATMELYDPDYPRGLFDWHLRSCGGELPATIPRSRASRALQVMSAAEPWDSSPEFSFPTWCRDLPRPGLRFSPGDPVCTVHAGGATPSAATNLVRRRQNRLAVMLRQSSTALMA